MDNIYSQLIDIIGDVPAGMEFIIYITACFILLFIIYFLSKMFFYIFKFIGGIS